MWASGHPNNVAERDALATVELLVAEGADPNLLDDRGRSALMIAAERGHPRIVAWLVAHGAKPDLRDKEGKTAADLASHPAVAEALRQPAN
jgi:ankyrin repeat protein